MTTVLALLIVQGCLGGFDTLWYHERKLRLPYDPTARRELILHASRDFIYVVIFAALAWTSWSGLWAGILAALLLMEIVITLKDFLEEDRTRKVPAGERVMHALMGLVYGAFLACLTPVLLTWMRQPTGFSAENYGWLSGLLTLMAVGVLASGIRDLAAASGKSDQRIT